MAPFLDAPVALESLVRDGGHFWRDDDGTLHAKAASDTIIRDDDLAGELAECDRMLSALKDLRKRCL
jgi:hypothetical protein